MDDLIAAIGSPQYDEYEDEPTQEKPVTTTIIQTLRYQLR